MSEQTQAEPTQVEGEVAKTGKRVTLVQYEGGEWDLKFRLPEGEAITPAEIRQIKRTLDVRYREYQRGLILGNRQERSRK